MTWSNIVRARIIIVDHQQSRQSLHFPKFGLAVLKQSSVVTLGVENMQLHHGLAQATSQPARFLATRCTKASDKRVHSVVLIIQLSFRRFTSVVPTNGGQSISSLGSQLVRLFFLRLPFGRAGL